MPRTALIPDIRKIELPEARQAIPHLHAYLRECILDGTLTPGTKLSQVTLSEQLGVSRTPLREVLRMLQEEGLVEIEPNQRTRVAGLDPQELDDIYASRILMETLALSMTIAELRCGGAQRGEAAAHGDASGGEERRHPAVVRRAHRLPPADHRRRSARRCSASYSCSPTGRSATSGSTSSPTRRAGRPPATSSTPQILEALVDGDRRGALTGMAHHLARTALRVLADCAPGYQPVAVPHAVALIDRRPPAALRLTGAS